MTTTTDRETRIAKLRSDYAEVHAEAMRRIRSGAADAALADLQARELEIDRQLRALGARLGA